MIWASAREPRRPDGRDHEARSSRRAREQPTDAVLVVGDVNSTIACALVAVKLAFRSPTSRRAFAASTARMPEEINRILTDAISDWLFFDRADGAETCGARASRGADPFVGNVMIDTLCRDLAAWRGRHLARPRARPGAAAARRTGYGVVTLHRPSNVDDASPPPKRCRR